MNRKRILRSWWLWAVVILFGFLVLPGLLSGGSGYHGVNTSDALAQITPATSPRPSSTTRSRRSSSTLKTQFNGKYTKISTQYPADASTDRSTARCQAARRPSPSTVPHARVTKENTWLSLLVSLLPILLIVGVLFFVMSQVQGGGNRVMSFGKQQGQARQQGHPEDDVRRRRRRRRGDRGTRRDQGVPRQPGEVPGHRRQDPQGRAALRPARHRQDAARPRGRRRGRRAVLLDLRLGLRRDVRRCRRLAACATCSSRPRPTRRRSSSSTRSTPSAGTAAPAWAAATTSASRR